MVIGSNAVARSCEVTKGTPGSVAIIISMLLSLGTVQHAGLGNEELWADTMQGACKTHQTSNRQPPVDVYNCRISRDEHIPDKTQKATGKQWFLSDTTHQDVEAEAEVSCGIQSKQSACNHQSSLWVPCTTCAASSSEVSEVGMVHCATVDAISTGKCPHGGAAVYLILLTGSKGSSALQEDEDLPEDDDAEETDYEDGDESDFDEGTASVPVAPTELMYRNSQHYLPGVPFKSNVTVWLANLDIS